MFDDVREQHGMAMWQAESGADLYEAPGGELLAMDILNGHPPCRLDSLFGRVLGGAVPGALLSRQAVRMGCEHMTAAVLCLDVDRTGLTLMKVSHDDATTAYVPFERPVASGAQLALELSALFDAGGWGFRPRPDGRAPACKCGLAPESTTWAPNRGPRFAGCRPTARRPGGAPVSER